MHAPRFVLIRRLTACLLMLCSGLFSAEALLADVHDGDATHGELVRADGAGDHAAVHVAHGDAPEAVQVGAQPDAPDDHPGERAPGQSGHTQHSCHCVHVHGGWLQAPPSFAAALGASHTTPVAFGDQAPASRNGEPQLRPPIA